MLCFRYLQRRRIVLLSMAAVAISCALLIVTDSLFTGFIDTIENAATQHFGDVVIEAPTGHQITDYKQLIEQLETSEVVRAATPVLSGQGLLLAGPGKVKTVMAWGIELPQRFEVDPLQDAFIFQKNKSDDQIGFAVPDDPEAVGGIVSIGVLGKPDEVTDEYDFESMRGMVGKTMALTTGSVTSDSEYSRKTLKFKLADVLMTGWYQIDEAFILLPLETLSSTLYPDQPHGANLIHIRLESGTDPNQGLAAVQNIWQDFSRDRFAWGGFASAEFAKTKYARLIVEYKKQMKVLLLIFGLVSGGIIFLVFCIFYLIVMTRRKDIGILKSCGMSSLSVAGIFVSFGSIIGAVGSGFGILLGWFVIENINLIENAIAAIFGLKIWKASTYMFTRIPNTMDWSSIWWIIVAGITAAAIGSLIPAIAAARVKPVRTLQYE